MENRHMRIKNGGSQAGRSNLYTAFISDINVSIYLDDIKFL